ncbi:MAG: AAA-like domain-containing protein [Blastocatellia bacterium]
MIDLPSAKRKIFISYKHKVEPDQSVVDRVVGALEQLRHTVFIDKKTLPGLEWGKWIQERIGESDYLIVFLTEPSARSEMVKAEVELAHALAQKPGGRPKIIPVRLAYHDEFDYPLSAYLNHIQWAEWDSEADTPRLIEQLKQAVAGQSVIFEPTQTRADPTQPDQSTEPPPPTPSAQPKRLDPAKLDSPEGTIDPQSAFYLVRSSDSVALDAIQRQGVTITIKGPRQMGKSSLLIRTMEKAVKSGKRAVFLDYQLIERDTLTDADRFYRRFCDWVTDELEMENRVDEFWNTPLGNSQRCTRYFSRYLLKELNQPLVLAMDEVENLFDTSFRSDFFSMLRSWHNSRANIATPIWKQLDLVLVTSTEPYQLIENLNQSPFNVGEVINLEDFTREQVTDLNQRHGSPLSADEEQRLMNLLNGHPYLTRRALYLIATDRASVTDLFAKATDDRGPFGDHLRYHLFRMHNKQELIKGLCDVLLRNTCDDETIFFRLRGAGLIKRVDQTVQPRCQLYANFFREHLKCQQR